MANSWSITINQLSGGALTFTPDIPGAHVNQPLGVFSSDNVTWNNRTNLDIALQQIAPPVDPTNPTLIPFDSIPAGSVSNPIFNVTLPNDATALGYSASIVAAKPSASRKRTLHDPAPVFWILVLTDPNS
jgi:hypothetical protein